MRSGFHLEGWLKAWGGREGDWAGPKARSSAARLTNPSEVKERIKGEGGPCEAGLLN